MQQPFNEWLQSHFDQGFTWRPGSVGFRTLEEEGVHNVELILVKDEQNLSPDAVRIFEVPFEVPADEDVEIASITVSIPISIKSGKYSLRCEFFSKNEAGEFLVKIILRIAEAAEFKVLRADSDLNVPEAFVTTANSAQ